MKLEVGKVRVNDVQFGEKTCIENHVLYVNAQEIIDLVMQDDRLASCTVDLARPGESVRIAPVKDVIEPRLKISGPATSGPALWARLIALAKVSPTLWQALLLLPLVRS